MSNENYNGSDPGDRPSTLLSNVRAIRAVTAAVEGTLGPKGLDTLLVNREGDVVVTNDGVTILNLMEITHPAAQMLVQIARAQQKEVGDGTTTATLLAGALVEEGAALVQEGVPVTRVIEGIQKGIAFALHEVRRMSRTINDLADPRLLQVASVAGREHVDIAALVVKAAQQLGKERLRKPSFRLADRVIAREGAESEVFHGLLLNRKRMNSGMPDRVDDASVLLLDDALEAERIDGEALRTESGFQTYMQYREDFHQAMQRLVKMGVRFIAATRSISPLAEEILVEAGIMAVQRIPSRDLKRLADYTGARPLKRISLNKPPVELKPLLGRCHQIWQDESLEMIRLEGGQGHPLSTILIGATTREIAGERERIARDAASAVQAAVQGGVVPGGGAVELHLSLSLEKFRETLSGMSSFGVGAVAKALNRPMTQIVRNAGFNPLEIVERVKNMQRQKNRDSLGIDCDSGEVADMIEKGILDPAPVKYYALKAAGEVASAVLRIQTVVRMRSNNRDEETISLEEGLP